MVTASPAAAHGGFLPVSDHPRNLPRVLFVEWVTPGRFHAGVFFPFAKGLLADRGAAVRWLRFAVPPDVGLREEGAGAALADDDLAALVAALREQQTSHAVYSHRPSAALVNAVAEARSGVEQGLLGVGEPPTGEPGSAAARIRVLRPEAASLASWIFGPAAGPPLSEAPLACYHSPDYAFAPANAAAREMRPFVYLFCGPACAYGRPLSQSGFFRGRLADEPAPKHRGCSFCSDRGRYGAAFGGTDESWTLLRSQLAAIRDTHPPVEGPLLCKLFSDRVSSQPRLLAEEVLAASLPPARLLLDLRADQIVRLEGQLRETAPTLAAAGHRLDVCVVGMESFSARQLDRFHKGYPPERNLQALRILRALEAELPGAFGFSDYGGLSTILYDPWASVGDVALNIAVARHFRLGPLCGKLLTSRLRLAEGLPLTDAARADGLLRAGYDDRLLDTARRNFYAEEIPWAFADERLEPLNRLTTRLAAVSEGADDSLAAALGAWQAETGLDVLVMAASLTAAAGDDDEPQTPLALLDRARARAARPAGPPAFWPHPDADPVRRWLDESWEASAFRSGVKPVMKIEEGPTPELQDRLARLLAEEWPGIVQRWRQRRREGGEVRELFAGRDPAEVEEAVAITGRFDSSEDEEAVGEQTLHSSILRVGELLGYPSCCSRAFIAHPTFLLNRNDWLHVRRRLEWPGPVPPELNPALLCYVPCSLDCAATLAAMRRVQRHRRRGDWSRWATMPTLLFLERREDVAVLRPLSRVEEERASVSLTRYRFAYELAYARTNRARLAVLRRGDEIVIEPGLVRVRGDGRDIAAWGLACFPWWHERVFHEAFWWECVREIERTPPAAAQVDSAEEPRTEERAEEADPHAALRAGLAESLRVALARTRTQRPALLRGFDVAAIAHHETGSGWGVIEVLLARGGVRLHVQLTEGVETERAFARTPRFAVAHGADTPVDTPDKPHLLRLLVRVLERVT